MKTAREVLDKIDEFLSSNSVITSEQEDLWAVLTALRGEDYEHETSKPFTTAPIRGAALPRCLEQARQYGRTYHRLGFRISSPLDYRPDPQGNTYHFNTHIRLAATALELNKSKEVL